MTSSKEAREAEAEARHQRLSLARLLKVDESKAESASDKMLLKRMIAATADNSGAYDRILAECGTSRLFSSGALYFVAAP